MANKYLRRLLNSLAIKNSNKNENHFPDNIGEKKTSVGASFSESAEGIDTSSFQTVFYSS